MTHTLTLSAQRAALTRDERQHALRNITAREQELQRELAELHAVRAGHEAALDTDLSTTESNGPLQLTSAHH